MSKTLNITKTVTKIIMKTENIKQKTIIVSQGY